MPELPGPSLRQIGLDPYDLLVEANKETMGKLIASEQENTRLRAALEEIAGHRIDSEFASLEKRNMAMRALNR